MNSWKQVLAEIGESALLGSVEPGPIRFSRSHEYDVPRVTAAIRRASDGKLARFGAPVNRNSFLLGCLDYTGGSAIEHLMVGYGVRHGSTTRVSGLHYFSGGRNAVAIPASVFQTMADHYEHDTANEVILFHNHPNNFLNMLSDNLPLASRADRQIARSLALNQNQLLRSLAGKGRILFYLGENGFVKQFYLPASSRPNQREMADMTVV